MMRHLERVIAAAADGPQTCQVVQSRSRKASRSPSRPLKNVSESIKTFATPRPTAISR